jgi:YD repeat-containing protein
MRFRTIAVLLLLTTCLAGASAQDSKFFRDKLGKPSELYRHRSGINVQIDYDAAGQVCDIYITDPDAESSRSSFPRLLAVADELIPASSRGVYLGRTGDLGNCTKVDYKDYERVFMKLDENACGKQSIQIYFKRASCPKPPKVRGLMSDMPDMPDVP